MHVSMAVVVPHFQDFMIDVSCCQPVFCAADFASVLDQTSSWEVSSTSCSTGRSLLSEQLAQPRHLV